MGVSVPHKERPDESALVETDPSEAVRSDELLEQTEVHFDIQTRLDYGGTILHHLLYDLVQNFSPEECLDSVILELLCFEEEILLRAGRLPSDFTVVVARQKKGAVPVVAPVSIAKSASEYASPQPTGTSRILI